MGMCVMNRAGPGRQSASYCRLDWTFEPGVPIHRKAIVQDVLLQLRFSESRDLQPQLLKSLTCSGTRQTVMALLWKRPSKQLRFGEVHSSLWLALQGLFNYLYTICLGLLLLYSTTAEWTHIHILRPYHPMLKKGGFTVRHLAPISKSYKDRIRTNKKKF